MEAMLQNGTTSKSTATFFVPQLSFMSVVLSFALTCRAVPPVIHRTAFQCTLCRGCSRPRGVSQNSPVALCVIMK